MLIVKKKIPTKEEINEWLSTVSGFIEGFTSINDEPTKLYDYQIESQKCNDYLQTDIKARQVGVSFGDAAEGLGKCHLKKEHTSIYVSINLEEAKEKIRYAQILYDSLPLAWKKKRITDTKTEQEFEDNTGKYRARLISHPQRPVRGKSADVYLDEFAHYQNQKDIYVSAIPVITRGQNILKIRSTPLGKGDIFSEIVTDTEKYKGFIRRWIYWWDCPELCTNVEESRKKWKLLNTKERVENWGTEKLKLIFYSMDLEDFQQEYECQFNDEETAYYPYELITPCAKDVDELAIYDDYEKLKENIKGQLFAGFDVGRKKDKSELWIMEKIGDRFYDRILKTLDRKDFDTQELELTNAMNILPIIRLGIDQNGIGMQLSEHMLKKYGKTRVEQVAFTNESKEQMAINVHRLYEQKNFWHRNTREVINQIHSIKKVLLPGGKHRYDAERNEKHHADKFWAGALAILMGLTPKNDMRVRYV